MDKYEYRIRAEEINSLIEQQEYAEAVKIADTIDWRRVRRVEMLRKISELYKINRRYEDSKEILLLAYDQQPQTPIYKKIVYSLCELSIKLEEVVQAVEYYKEFVQIAPKDTGRFILQYRLYEAQDVSLEERIAVLEEYKKRDYREKWAYELAYLYHRIGLATRCVEECDELILWFGEGKYVIKAMELKMLHAPLSLQQQEKYNARFLSEMDGLAEEEEENHSSEEIEPSMPIEIKSINLTKAKTARIPSKKIQEESLAREEGLEIGENQNEEEPEESAEEIPVEEPANYENGYDRMDDPDTQETKAEPEDVETGAETEDEASDRPDDMDIQIKTIDVGDQYSTINLQEALAKDLAKLFAEEDMGQVDATRALPVDTVEIASKIMNRQEELTNNTTDGQTEGQDEEEPLAQTPENEAEAVKPEEPEESEHTDESEVAFAKQEGDVDDLTMLLPPMDLTLGQKDDDLQAEVKDEQEDTYILDEQETGEIAVGEENADFDESSETKELPLDEIREYLRETSPLEIKEEDLEREKEILASETKVIPTAEINEALEDTSEEDPVQTEEQTEKFMIQAEQPEEAAVTQRVNVIDLPEEEETAKAGQPIEGIAEQASEAEEAGETKELPLEEIREMLKEAALQDPKQEVSAQEEAILASETKVIPVAEINEVLDEISEADPKEDDKIEESIIVEDIEEIEDGVSQEQGITEEAQLAEEQLQEEPLKEEIPQEESGDENENSESEAEPKTIEPPIYGNNVAMSEDMLEQWKNIAIEAAKQAAVEAAAQAAKQAAAQAAQEAAMEAAKATANVMQAIVPEKVEEKEPEVMQEEEVLDQQITGQLSFSDIMSEWEKTQKENEEKHIEELKQRVLEQTGPLYPDQKLSLKEEDSLSMISPMLDVFSETEDLANEVEQALKEETEGIPETGQDTAFETKEPEVREPEQVEKQTVGTEEALVEESSKEAEQKTSEEQSETRPEDVQTDVVEEEKPEEPVSDNPNKFNTAEINGLEEKLLSTLSSQHYETANMQVEALSAEMSQANVISDSTDHAETGKTEEAQTNEARSLTKEERDLFGPIAQTKQLQENLATALDAISLVPHTGNVIITAEVGIDKIEIAKQITTYFSQIKCQLDGKVSVFDFEDLKSKDIIATFDEHANGAIIIDSAGKLSQQAMITITNALKGMTDKKMVMILTDTKPNIDKLKLLFEKLSDYFSVELNINSLDIDGLVKFGKEYARSLEYSIDAMGVLALYNRIEERQTADHAVTVDEVKEIVNSAIEKAEKKSLSNFMDIVFAKKYDKDAMTLLREKDFLEDKK